MSRRDHSRGRSEDFRGDSYRPSDWSRQRSLSRPRPSHHDARGRVEETDTRPSVATRRANSFAFGLDDTQPPSHGLVTTLTTPTDSPRSPVLTARNDGGATPVGASAMSAQDPRLFKKQFTPLRTANKDDTAVSTNIVDTSNKLKHFGQTAKANPHGLVQYFYLLVQQAGLQKDIDAVNKRIAEKKQQKLRLMETHPEMREIQTQIGATIDQSQIDGKSLVNLKKQNDRDIDATLNAMSTEMKSLLYGILPTAVAKEPGQVDRTKLDVTAMSKRIELLEGKDKLRELEKENLERKMLTQMEENEKKWQARIQAMEERDQKREEAKKLFESDLLAKIEAAQQNHAGSVSVRDSAVENNIKELRDNLRDHKLKFANLPNQFIPAKEYNELLKDFADIKNSNTQLIKISEIKFDSTTAKVVALETGCKKSNTDLSILTEDVKKVKSEFAQLKELEGQYQGFWNTTNQRLKKLESHHTSVDKISVLHNNLSADLQAHISDSTERQTSIEHRTNVLETETPGLVTHQVLEGLRTDIDKLAQSIDQCYEAFAEKARKDPTAVVNSVPTTSTQTMTPADRKELADLRTDITKAQADARQAEFSIRSLNSQYNQISTNALYKDILRWIAPQLSRIPVLEEATKSHDSKITKVEEDASAQTAAIADIRQKMLQSNRQSIPDAEALAKIATLETRFVKLAQSRNDSVSTEKLDSLQTCIQTIEDFQAQHLPLLYYAKKDGDESDRRLHNLESLEIPGDLEDLRSKHAANMKQQKDLQLAIDDQRDDIKNVRKECKDTTKLANENRRTCDQRQQELDSQKRQLETLTNTVAVVETTVAKFTERVDRMDEETKTDIRTLKNITENIRLNEVSLLSIKNLASSIKTAEAIVQRLKSFRIHKVWFDGAKKPDGSTTFCAIAVVNAIDVDDIRAKFNGAKWQGRTIQIDLVPHNVLIERIPEVMHSKPTPETLRESTVVSSTSSPLVSRPLPISPLVRTGIEDESLAASKQTSVSSSPPSSNPKRISATHLSGTKSTPHVINDSQEQDEDDDGDTIEVNQSPRRPIIDPANIEAWRGLPPSRPSKSAVQKVRNSPALQSRNTSATPSASRKRAADEDKSGSKKKARQT